MISLPQEDYEENKELISDCISRLRERGVEIRNSIRCEDLESIANYDIVIIVSHHDKDRDVLVLKDETLSVGNFIGSLPSCYSGDIDLSSCSSVTFKNAIKKRCPNCKPQVAKKDTRLSVRLVAYPFVVDRIYENSDRDYNDTYLEVLNELEDAAANNPENDTYNDDSLRLGQKRTSVAYPSEAKRKSLVPIHVFLHYASEKEEVEIDINNRYSDKDVIVRINSKEFSDIEIGDSLIFELTFMGYDTQHLQVKDGNKRDVVVSGEIDEIIFTVGIDEEFSSPNFGCCIGVYKGDNNNGIIKKYPFVIRIENYENDVPIHKTVKPGNFADCVIKPESVDAVIKLLHEQIEGLTKPRDIMMRICAAIDAGVIRKPTWYEFCAEFGNDKIKSKTSFNDYIQKNHSKYYNEISAEKAYNRLIEIFKELLN